MPSRRRFAELKGMPRSRRRHRAPVSSPWPVEDVPCRVAQEALSALLDGESSPVDELALSAHLGECSPCRAYDARARVLTRRMRVRVYEPPPDHAAEVMAILACVERAPRAAIPERRSALRCRHWSRVGWSRVGWWAAGVVPVGLVVPALAVGALVQFHVVGSHPITPCTRLLSHVLRHR